MYVSFVPIQVAKGWFLLLVYPSAKVSRNLCEKRLIGPPFFRVNKAINTVWADGFLYKLMILSFPSYIVKTF